MTKDEKLKKALEALRDIGNGDDNYAVRLSSDMQAKEQAFFIAGFAECAKRAALVYAELTAPKMETVEVKRYMIANPSGGVFSDVFMSAEGACAKAMKTGYPDAPIITMTGTYQRHVPEPEEVWEGELAILTNNDCIVRLDKGFNYMLRGSRVEVRLKEEK